ncbi:unnamed protein product [Meganyctiphanes norvegica]|uniref:Cytochrome P450 n=1 Tax=Meganyctiphanes norvegica TaxID=48144 RepID=A0AAV2PXJ7_MEGNR
MLVEAILFVLVAALLIYLVTKENLPNNVPKGPLTIPGLGSLDYCLYLSDMRRLRDKYGDIFLMKMGSKYMVYLCNYQLVKEAFSSPHVVDRPQFQMLWFLTDGVPAGVAFTDGEQWSTLRKFLMRQMRNLGMGKSYMEDAIMSEARKLANDFEKRVDKPAKIPKSVEVSVLNIVWQLVANKDYEYDDKKVIDLMDLMHKWFVDTGYLVLPDFFPILNYLPKFLRNYLLKEHITDELKKKCIDFTKETIEEHRANLDCDNPVDVIDHYLIEMDEQQKNPNGPQFKSDLDLTMTIFDLFAAGFDTTSSTLRWLILYVASHPEVQRKLHEEIDSVLQSDEEISLNHKDSLPYLEATIYETHRYCSFAMAGVFHQTSKDIQLGGHTIPKGTHVYACQALCHEDPNYWKEPEKFQPERFIDENGKFKSQKESFMPFGIGRRQCIGEALAHMELYLVFAMLLQKFHFAPPQGVTLDLEPKQQPLVHYCKDQDLIITLRNTKPEE